MVLIHRLRLVLAHPVMADFFTTKG